MKDVNQDTVPVDALKKHAKAIFERNISQEDVRQMFSNDYVLSIFTKGIREKLIKRECLSILIKAQTTKGKSTLAFFLMRFINKMITDLGQKTSFEDEDQLFQLISSNQIEFTRIARRPDLYNVCTTIDEYSHMGETGAQATIERQQFRWRENVCAQKFIHKIMCTPSSEYDEVALLILHIIDKDETNKTVLCKLFYNDPTETIPIYLGNLMFDIHSVLGTYWLNLYRIKKFFAIELAEQDMIRDVRELEEALVVLLTIIKCTELAESGHGDRNLTKCRVRDSAREIGAVYSIIGEELVYKYAQSVIELMVEKSQLIRRLKKNANKMTLEELQQIRKTIDIYTDNIRAELQKYLRLTKLYIKYMSIGDNQIGLNIQTICDKYGIDLGTLDPSEDIRRVCEKYKLDYPAGEQNGN